MNDIAQKKAQVEVSAKLKDWHIYVALTDAEAVLISIEQSNVCIAHSGNNVVYRDHLEFPLIEQRMLNNFLNYVKEFRCLELLRNRCQPSMKAAFLQGMHEDNLPETGHEMEFFRQKLRHHSTHEAWVSWIPALRMLDENSGQSFEAVTMHINFFAAILRKCLKAGIACRKSILPS